MNAQKFLALAIICAFVTACGAGGGSTPPTSGGPVNSGPSTLALKFTFNTKSTALRKHSANDKGGRRANYVSYSTHGLGIDVASHIGDSVLPKNLTDMRSPAFATTIAAGYSGTNTTCSALIAGSYSCVLLVAAPSGYDDVQITTWDQAPSSNGFGGTFAGTANNLSTNFLANQLVLANQTNNFDFALDGVVASVALQVSPVTLVAGAPLGQAPNPAAITLTVKAIDAQGNMIVGNDPYVDANGNLVTINVSKTESYPAPVPSPSTGPVVGPTAPPGGDLTITTSAFTSPAVTTSAVTYNGYDIASVLFNATVTEIVGGADVTGPVSKATLNFTQSTNGGLNVLPQPAVSYFDGSANPLVTVSTSGGGGSPLYWGYLAQGPDGNLYVTNASAHTVTQISPSGAVLNTFNVALQQPTVIAMGSDNAMYFIDTQPGPGNFTVSRMTTNGSVTDTYNTGAPGAGASDVRAMTLGPDGNLWFTDLGNNRVGKLATAGGAVTYVSGASMALPTGIAAGPDGNLWVTEYGNGNIDTISTAGVLTPHAYGFGGGDYVYGITAGPDGRMWVVLAADNALAAVTTGFSMTTYGATGCSQPNFVTTGADGNLWFTCRFNNTLGRMTTAGFFSSISTGVTDGSLNISAGTPGGKVWFGTFNTQVLGNVDTLH